MKGRIVHLLGVGDRELTAAQRAQRKYRASPKGREVQRRYLKKRRQDPAYRAYEVARCKAWREANALRRRVYNRTYMRRYRREKRASRNAPRA